MPVDFRDIPGWNILENFNDGDKVTTLSPKMSVLLDVLLVTGCEISELLNVKISDIEPVGNLVKFSVSGRTMNGKPSHHKRKPRIIYVTRELMDRTIQEWKTANFTYLFHGAGSEPITRGYVWREFDRAGKSLSELRK